MEVSARNSNVVSAMMGKFARKTQIVIKKWVRFVKKEYV